MERSRFSSTDSIGGRLFPGIHALLCRNKLTPRLTLVRLPRLRDVGLDFVASQAGRRKYVYRGNPIDTMARPISDCRGLVTNVVTRSHPVTTRKIAGTSG